MTILPTMLLVRDHKTEIKTASGLFIPETKKKSTITGDIVTVGSGTKDVEMIFNVGEVAHYSSSAGRIVEVDGEELRLLGIENILYAE
jgi:chaperonin GroES